MNANKEQPPFVRKEVVHFLPGFLSDQNGHLSLYTISYCFPLTFFVKIILTDTGLIAVITTKRKLKYDCLN